MSTNRNTKCNNLPDDEIQAESHTQQRKQNHLKIVRLPTKNNTPDPNDSDIDGDGHKDVQQQSPLVKRSVLTLLVLLLAACGSTRSNIDQGQVSAQSLAQSQFKNYRAQPVSQTVSTAIRSIGCDADENSLQQALLSLINDARAQIQHCGSKRYSPAATLTSHPTLQKVARSHSRDMADNDYFSHQDNDGLQVWDRALTAGYEYSTIAENIATGQDTTGEVHDGWLGSPGHCANLMNPEITHFGAACADHKNTDNQPYWTTVFGRERKTL